MSLVRFPHSIILIMTTLLDVLTECFNMSEAREGPYPVVVEPYECPPVQTYDLYGRKSPLYCLGWLIPLATWSTYINPYPDEPDLESHSTSAVNRKWRELGYTEELPDWRAPCDHNIDGYAVLIITFNTAKFLRPLADANFSNLNVPLTRQLVNASASSLGLSEEMAKQVKWYNLDSLSRKRTAMSSRLDAYIDKIYESKRRHLK
ncbi:hypothetical protein NEOLEDRAFT_349696 [Neolentinus lepideus HHB14362 ss-1]|uniref:Uncharacterized protein n=1 Tax=Neolentinus lepideus HHB14362 ss-1 TaxID=1314782 RepID=A0A165SRJ4_9AGAM|nr:hypothetical protein NEOLEDRAFT_349696 [Neolentinus lepideus HHB14362 ss-1]